MRFAWLVACAVLLGSSAPSAARAAGGVKVIAQAGADAGLEAVVRQTAERCIPLLGSYFKTSLSGDVEIFIYASKEEFAAALEQAGNKPAMARRLANHPSVHAVASRMKVLINQATTMPVSLRNKNEMVCHELTHVYQNYLGGGSRPPSHQWMRESYAIYMGVVALEHFGLDKVSAVRGRAVRAMQEEARAGKPFQRLAGMVSFEQYRDTIDRHGSRTNTFYMFLAADQLVQRSSHEAVASYFRLSRPGSGSADIDENFRKAFSIGVGEFQSQLDAYLNK